MNMQTKIKWIVVLMLFVTVISTAITIVVLVFKEDKEILIPDYAPKETEGYAESIPDDGGGKLERPEGGGAVSLMYSKKVLVDLSEKKASLMFGNPSKSTQDMVVQIVVQDTVIVQSGRLTPGNRVLTLDLLDGIEKVLPEGGYAGEFVVWYYDQTTGEKAIVNTTIPITIEVIE